MIGFAIAEAPNAALARVAHRQVISDRRRDGAIGFARRLRQNAVLS
jgi:hypothetical protein